MYIGYFSDDYMFRTGFGKYSYYIHNSEGIGTFIWESNSRWWRFWSRQGIREEDYKVLQEKFQKEKINKNW